MDPLLGYAVHFTRGASPDEVALARSSNPPTSLGHLELMDWLSRIDDTGFQASLSVLWEGHIRATTYAMGVGAAVSVVAAGHRSACFSETPLDDLARLINTSWEQEWRVPGGLNFSPVDVAFCFLPAHLHDVARQFFEKHRAANTGPAYLGRYLDPEWDRAEIERALAA